MSRHISHNHYLMVLFSILFLATSWRSFAESSTSSTQAVLIIDDIICQGNENTDCDFITKKYYQKIGQVLDADEIADAQLRLGTLIQFKYISIHLEKSTVRNHVVVVFDVNEASNIQYELGTNYAYSRINTSNRSCLYSLTDNNNSYNFGLCDSYNHSNHLRLTSKVTNFNFWGTGKELSISLYGDFNKGEENRTLTSPLDLSLTDNQRTNRQNYGLGLSYYDPYLFDSAYYYLDVSTSISYSSIDDEKQNLATQQPAAFISNGVFEESDELSLDPLIISVGRRFARHSYVSFTAQANFDDSEQFYSAAYGWNSEDDILFPTTGSVFSTSINLDKDSQNLAISYRQNFSLANHNFLTLGTTTNTLINERDFTGIQGNIFVRYTSINAIDKLNGSYSGWHVGANIDSVYFKDIDYDSVSMGLSAGYTHQTENMIYRFSANIFLAETE